MSTRQQPLPSEIDGVPTCKEFYEHLFHNPEVCSNCFAKIRTVEKTTIRVGKNREKTVPYEFRTRTNDAIRGYDENNQSVTYCRQCGGDGCAVPESMPKSAAKDALGNIQRYLADEVGLDVDYGAMYATLGKLKSDQDMQGRDTEIFAAAVARGISSTSD